MKIIAVAVLFVRLTQTMSSIVNDKQVTLLGCELNDLRSEHYYNVVELYALHCDIPILENAEFLRHSELEVLDISDSRISFIQDYAFNGLKGLKSLNLARNNISEVKSWSNSDFTSLISLDLRRNSIHTLYSESFKRFPNLQKLNLAVNRIENIPYGVLRMMPHLRYVNLGKNFIKHIDFYTIRGLHKLFNLALHNNDIEYVHPQAFDTNNHLRSLRLESNLLEDLEFMAKMKLARLVHLNLSHNAISSLEHLTFSKDYELKSLDVSYNLIKEIYDDTLYGLESLEMFNASHNQIHTIAEQSFYELTSLTHIDISANNLTHLPIDTFNTTRHLIYLNLSGNALDHLEPNHFHEVQQLHILDLSSNRLHRDNFIEGLQRTQNSDPLSLPPSQSWLQLDLSNNIYSALNLSMLYGFGRVDLSGNLWDCKWLIQEMIRGPATIHFNRNYTVKDKENVLTVPGVDCYDEETKRSIIVLIGDGYGDWTREEELHEGSSLLSSTSLSSVFWSRMRLNQFDDKEIVIWILMAVIVGFIFIRAMQLVFARYIAKKRKRNERKPTLEKDPEKMEMMDYREETTSVASTVEESTKPKKIK